MKLTTGQKVIAKKISIDNDLPLRKAYALVRRRASRKNYQGQLTGSVRKGQSYTITFD